MRDFNNIQKWKRGGIKSWTPHSVDRLSHRMFISPKKPTGVIGESSNFAYYYNGNYYEVTEGCGGHLVTKMHLSFEEAKALFEALEFTNPHEPSNQVVSSSIKFCRKNSLDYQDMFWYFVDSIK